MKLNYLSTREDWAAAMRAIRGTVAGATRDAFIELSQQVRRAARAEIAAAGLSRRWQLGFKTDVFPRDPTSSAYLTMRGRHQIDYANVFERGATIHPKHRKLLWLPLPVLPAKINGRPMTAKAFVRSVGPLHSINRPGKPPMLAGYAMRPGKRVTLAQLRIGQRNARRRQARAAFGGRLGARPVSVTLFVGLSAVNIHKRLNISAIYDKGREDLPKLYAKHLAKLRR